FTCSPPHRHVYPRFGSTLACASPDPCGEVATAASDITCLLNDARWAGDVVSPPASVIVSLSFTPCFRVGHAGPGAAGRPATTRTGPPRRPYRYALLVTIAAGDLYRQRYRREHPVELAHLGEQRGRGGTHREQQVHHRQVRPERLELLPVPRLGELLGFGGGPPRPPPLPIDGMARRAPTAGQGGGPP